MERIPAKEICADTVEERPIPYACRRADALAHVAEGFLAGSGTASPASTADRYQVVVHVDAESLREHGEPLDVGRKTRSIPRAIRRALRTRDAGCRFPGCTHQRHVDAHHIEHWADGGETKLSNLVTLCRLHHRLVHEGQIRIEPQSAGGWRFMHPDGRHYEVIRITAPEYKGDELAQTHAELGILIDRDTAATRWRGERMDYDLGVWVLCQQAARARNTHDRGDASDSHYSDDSHDSNVSAETPHTFTHPRCATEAA